MTIVCIDDDAEDIAFFTEAAHEVNPDARIVAFQDLSTAFHWLEQSPECPDCIFLDIYMTPHNGLDYLKKLAAMPNPCKRIVMYTASDNPRDVAESFNRGATDFVQKPGSYDGLRRTLENFLK